jgi:hypothetical protein
MRIKDPKAALHWIVAILNRHRVPFQITGGLAAKAYGSDRDLVDIDIDIPEEAFSRIVPEVRAYLLFGPAAYRDPSWDLQLMTLLYRGQEIDLCGAHQARIFDQARKEWVNLMADFSTSEVKEVLGIPLPVVCRKDLLHYKRKLGRGVDRMDIAAIDPTENSR